MNSSLTGVSVESLPSVNASAPSSVAFQHLFPSHLDSIASLKHPYSANPSNDTKSTTFCYSQTSSSDSALTQPSFLPATATLGLQNFLPLSNNTFSSWLPPTSMATSTQVQAIYQSLLPFIHQQRDHNQPLLQPQDIFSNLYSNFMPTNIVPAVNNPFSTPAFYPLTPVSTQYAFTPTNGITSTNSPDNKSVNETKMTPTFDANTISTWWTQLNQNIALENGQYRLAQQNEIANIHKRSLPFLSTSDQRENPVSSCNTDDKLNESLKIKRDKSQEEKETVSKIDPSSIDAPPTKKRKQVNRTNSSNKTSSIYTPLPNGTVRTLLQTADAQDHFIKSFQSVKESTVPDRDINSSPAVSRTPESSCQSSQSNTMVFSADAGVKVTESVEAHFEKSLAPFLHHITPTSNSPFNSSPSLTTISNKSDSSKSRDGSPLFASTPINLLKNDKSSLNCDASFTAASLYLKKLYPQESNEPHLFYPENTYSVSSTQRSTLDMYNHFNTNQTTPLSFGLSMIATGNERSLSQSHTSCSTSCSPTSQLGEEDMMNGSCTSKSQSYSGDDSSSEISTRQRVTSKDSDNGIPVQTFKPKKAWLNQYDCNDASQIVSKLAD